MNPQSTPSYEKQPRDAAYWAQYTATLKVRERRRERSI